MLCTVVPAAWLQRGHSTKLLCVSKPCHYMPARAQHPAVEAFPASAQLKELSMPTERAQHALD